MSARIALDADPGLPGLLARVQRGLLRLKSLRARRPAPDILGSLSADALKDIGLTRSDLPAVQAGMFAGDDTRRKR